MTHLLRGPQMKRAVFSAVAALVLALPVSARPLRFLYWNVQCGMGEGLVDDYAEFVDWVKALDPDIFVWCEAQTTESESPNDFMPRHLPDIAARYGHAYSSIAWRGIFPQAVTSKYPIEKVRRSFGAPPANYVTHGSGWFRVEVPGREINVVTLHLSPYQGEAYRLIEMPQILDYTIGASRAAVGDWVMLGDYNCYSTRDAALYEGRTPEQIKASHLMDVQVHDFLREKTDYRDILFELQPDPEERWTVRGRRRIDFLYGSPSLADCAKSARVVRDGYTTWKPGSRSGVRPSDHLPIFVEFDLPDECAAGEDPTLVHARRELAFHAAKLLGGKPGEIPVTLAVDPGLGAQAYRLRTADGKVVIAGGDGAGVLYGLYDYLERCCGVRWYSADCEKVPRLRALPVPADLDVAGRPAFAVRGVEAYEIRRSGDFAAHLRLNGPVHSLHAKHAPWKGALPGAARTADVAPAKHALLPQPGVRELQALCRAARADGVAALDIRGWNLGFEADFAELRAYLAAKWLWDPEAPYEELVADFMEGCYGKAAPFVRAYFDRVQALKPVAEPKDLPADFIADSAALLAKALEAVKDDPVCGWRVRRTSLAVNYCRLCRDGMADRDVLKDFMTVWEYVGVEGQSVFNLLRDPVKSTRLMDGFIREYYK